MTDEQYGKRLRAWRTGQGLSQRDLSSQLEVSRGYIGDIEGGRSEPSRNFLMRLQERFGVRSDYILYGVGDAVSVRHHDKAPRPSEAPAEEKFDHILLMFCGGAVARAYDRAGVYMTRELHYSEAVTIYRILMSQMKDPEDGDELEALLPTHEDELLRRLLTEKVGR